METPKRGRERDADAARRAIVEAAADAFAAAGFDGARMDAIADAAGYSKALIVQYFGDKLGLYNAVVREVPERIEDAMGRLIERFSASDEPFTRERVRAFLGDAVRLTFDFHRANPRLTRILLWEAAAGWTTFRKFPPKPGSVTWRNTLLDTVRQAQALGIVRREVDPIVLFTNVMDMAPIHLISLPRYARVLPDVDFTSEEAIVRVREQMVSILLDGVCTCAHGRNRMTSETSETSDAGANAATVAGDEAAEHDR